MTFTSTQNLTENNVLIILYYLPNQRSLADSYNITVFPDNCTNCLVSDGEGLRKISETVFKKAKGNVHIPRIIRVPLGQKYREFGFDVIHF
jgi:hypothetical protein